MPKASHLTVCGERLFGQGLFEAASDFWHEALTQRPDRSVVVRAHNGLGKIALLRERPAEAITAFDQALAATSADDREGRAAVTMRRAVAHLKAGHRDQAFRDAHALVAQSDGLSAQRQGIVWGNLGGMQIDTELYEPAIMSLMRARQLLGSNSPYAYPICTNLGLSHLELRQLESAQHWFEQALAAAPTSAIHAVNGLAHVALLQGRADAMQRWSEAAFAAMWDGVASFEPEEMAHLAEVLGRMAWHAGHGRLAVRLLDHAQSFYGRSGRWNRWRSLSEAIVEAERQGDTTRTSPVLEELTRWTVLLENLAAQDLVEKRASQLADIRLFIANRLADVLGLGAADQKWLAYICRLADLGLSAVGEAPDPGTAMTAAGRALYEQHPTMSVQLLDRLGLPVAVTRAIEDHHERWDGHGFPAGKAGDEISLLGRIVATAEWYTRETTVHARRHRTVLADLQQEAGRALDPDCVEALVHVFDMAEGVLV